MTYVYRRFGAASPGVLPLVMLQHFRGNLDDWDPLLLGALASGREVIPVDNAGVGLSSGTVPRAGTPDFAVRFTSSGQALRDLTSPHAIDRIMGGLSHGAVRLEGSALILLWFDGLARRLASADQAGSSRRALPSAYLAHDPASNGAEKITIEPPVRQLDPRWTAAWNARARRWIVRGASGDPLQEP